MKDIKIYTSSSVLFVLLLSSCSSTQHSYRTSNIPNKNVISGEVVVDIKLDLTKKIEATSSLRNSVDEAKEEAYYKAIVQNNIDIIVDPIYQITTTDRILIFGGKSIAKISGFGANYVNPRSKVEAIGELTKLDTTNISKFNAIYFNKSLKKVANKSALISGSNSATSSKSGTTKTKKSYNKEGLSIELVRVVSTLDLSTDTNSSFGIGISNFSNFSKKMGFNLGLAYSPEGTASNNLKYIRVPATIDYEIFNVFSIGAGAQFGYCFSADLPKADSANDFDYGILTKFGYRLSKSLSIEIKSYKGISEATEGGLKNNNSQIGLSYHF